jgi:hypothetical protein
MPLTSEAVGNQVFACGKSGAAFNLKGLLTPLTPLIPCHTLCSRGVNGGSQ